MAKAKKPIDEQFEKQEFNLFEALAAIDKKDYSYYSRLTNDQKKKFAPYMLLIWTSCVKANADTQRYYLQSIDYHVNKHFFNENITKNPELQWLMLCAASPGIGKQFHQWLPHIKPKVLKLEEKAEVADIVKYYEKIYPKTDKETINELAQVYTQQQHRKVYLAEKFIGLKFDDIEVLNSVVTDEDIEQYERDYGN